MVKGATSMEIRLVNDILNTNLQWGMLEAMARDIVVSCRRFMDTYL